MSPRPTIPNRRERLLEEAERLILERGFAAMTMQDLAERVGIDKGSVYLEFGSKEELLDVLLTSASEAWQRASSERLPADASLADAYRAAGIALLDQPLLCAAFLDPDGVLGAQVAATIDDRFRDRHRAVAGWLSERRAAGRLSPDVDPDGLALALSSATLGLLSASKILGPFSREQLVAALDSLAQMTAALEVEPPSA